MKLNLKRPLAIFDLETTGVNVASDRILEIAIIKIHPDGRIEKKPEQTGSSNRFLVKPMDDNGNEMAIPLETSMIHGVYNEDVKDAPTFKEIAPKLFKFLFDCDLGGFNSNKFDIPILAEEFLRAGIEFSMEGRNAIDVQNIFHLMEQRTLKAAYKFYCDKELEGAHEAMPDTQATYEVLLAQVEKYGGKEVKDKQGNMYVPVTNDMDHLHKTSQRQRNVDFIGRVVLNGDDEPCINFGKHKGKTVVSIFATEPSYYHWMMKGDFPLYTKKVMKDLWEDFRKQ